MKFGIINGLTHIIVDVGESEQDVLRKIAKLILKQSTIIDINGVAFSRNESISDDEADRYIDLNDGILHIDHNETNRGEVLIHHWSRYGDFVVSKWSHKVSLGELLNRNESTYRQIRGSVCPDMDKLIGTKLDKFLEKYNQTRNDRESDWDFRKRVFSELYDNDKHAVARNVILGSTLFSWGVSDHIFFTKCTELTKLEIKELVANMSVDPVRTRDLKYDYY